MKIFINTCILRDSFLVGIPLIRVTHRAQDVSLYAHTWSQGHVRPVKGLLIPFSFLPSASCPVYAFWSSHSGVIDLEVQLSALRWNRWLYDIIVYVDECTSKVDGFIRTVSFALCERLHQTFKTTLII